MTVASYDILNNLEEKSFIAGTDQLYTFVCYQSDGVNLLSIAGGSATWKLCPYGEFGINTITKTGSIIDANSFTVTLDSSDTISLSGKYIQQVSVTDFYGDTFAPGQGIILIFPVISD